MPLQTQLCELVLPGGRRVLLGIGVELRRSDIPQFPPGPAAEVIARVSAKPGDASVLGLTNLASVDWIAESPRKGRQVVASGQTVRIEPDVTIQFGSARATIRRAGSVPVQMGWCLRIVSGEHAGMEFPLQGQNRCTLGGQPPANIILPDPTLKNAPVCELIVGSDYVEIQASNGLLKVNGRTVPSAHLRPNDEFQLGNLTLRVINQQLAYQMQYKKGNFLQTLPAPTRNGLVAGTLAGILVLLFTITGNLRLLPATLIALSLVVPIIVLTRLLERYNTSNISINTLLITFLLGGSLGLIAAVGPQILLGVPPILWLAGLWEEPAKLIATAWRWKHPAYDKPLDGLIIGTTAGFGFAVAETAGYGLDIFIKNSLAILDVRGMNGDLLIPTLSQHGLISMLFNLIFRNLLSPYGHCLWTGILCAAFWECGRNLKKAVRDPRFLKALATVIVLHGLWDSPLGLIGILLSAGITSHLYKQRLQRKGYSQ